MGHSACIATVMVIIYLERMGGPNADISYNVCWLGLWVFAEISFGITVTGTFLLPKFIEAEGAKLRGVFSSLTRPLTSLTSGSSFGASKKDSSASQDVTLDTVTMIGGSESDVASSHHDLDVERCPSYWSIDDGAKYPSVGFAGDGKREVER